MGLSRFPTLELNIKHKTGWWLSHPSEKYFVSWDDDIPNIWKVINVPKHQPLKPKTIFDMLRNCVFSSFQVCRKDSNTDSIGESGCWEQPLHSTNDLGHPCRLCNTHIFSKRRSSCFFTDYQYYPILSHIIHVCVY